MPSIRLVATKMYAYTRILSRPQAANENLQDYTHKFTDLVNHATGTDPAAVTCQVTTVLFIRHLFNK